MSVTRFRNFVFTLNNPTITGPEFLEHLKTSLPIRYVIFQLEEAPNTGTRHFQGYIELSKQVTFSKAHSSLFNAHIENRKGSAQEASAYCKKPESRVDGPWTEGQLSNPGARTDIKAAVDAVERGGITLLAKDFPEMYVQYRSGLSSYDAFINRSKPRDAVTVHLLYGPSGCGKTRFAWSNSPDLVSIPGDMQWFDNYVGDSTVLFDDFDGAASKCTLRFLLQLLDRYPLRLPIKGGHTAARWNMVYITSNIHPRLWFQWLNREEQYNALSRRINTVSWWKSNTDMVQLNPGTDDWIHFWRGPPTPPPPPMGSNGWIEHTVVDPYNF